VPNDVLTFNTTAIDCVFNMRKNNRNFVILRNKTDIKVIYLKDILTLFNSNSNFLNKRLHLTKSLDEIIEIQHELPAYVKNYVLAGTDINIITHTITGVSDTITERIITQALNHCGKPPCKFAFLALGSEGRSERGLATDQDNAIIFEDVPESDLEKIKDYFHELASIINVLLDKAGYKLCIGEIMANNPRWCQPISVWKQYFHQWIQLPEPQSLIDSSIFFDIRCIYGNKDLSNNLRDFISNAILQNPSFLIQHAILTVNYKLPVGMFGKIQTEQKEEQTNVFNLKNAIRLIVNIVRIYAMKYSIVETNTLLRLEELYYLNYIPKSFYREIQYCFKFLMNIQFKEQANNYLKGNPVDNYLDLSGLNQTELSNLKTVLSTIASFQSRIKYDFGVSESK
jgi:CBS domain-containing protein